MPAMMPTMTPKSTGFPPSPDLAVVRSLPRRLPAGRPASGATARRVYAHRDSAVKGGDLLDYVIHRLPDHVLVPVGQRDDRIVDGLDRLDQQGVDHKLLAVEPAHPDHPPFPLFGPPFMVVGAGSRRETPPHITCERSGHGQC